MAMAMAMAVTGSLLLGTAGIRGAEAPCKAEPEAQPLHSDQRGGILSTTEAEGFMTRAEECRRLAGACIAGSNPQILIYAVHWRMLAEVTASYAVTSERRELALIQHR